MTVFIDNYNARYKGMIMCHMIADSTDELLAMADAIGVQRKWIQFAGTPREHFDICAAKKRAALAHGAVDVECRQLALLIACRRGTASESQRHEVAELRAAAARRKRPKTTITSNSHDHRAANDSSNRLR